MKSFTIFKFFTISFTNLLPNRQVLKVFLYLSFLFLFYLFFNKSKKGKRFYIISSKIFFISEKRKKFIYNNKKSFTRENLLL